jgi:hypothetical protein
VRKIKDVYIFKMNEINALITGRTMANIKYDIKN